MLIIKNIFAFFTAAIVLLSSNGFIFEQYFCSGCQSNHSEVAFFEFGELSHDHDDCETCVSHGHTCNCHSDDHLSNTKITFYSLDLLYLDYQNAQKLVISKTLELKHNLLSGSFTPLYDLSKVVRKVLKKPYLQHIDSHSDVDIALISVFRL